MVSENYRLYVIPCVWNEGAKYPLTKNVDTWCPYCGFEVDESGNDISKDHLSSSSKSVSVSSSSKSSSASVLIEYAPEPISLDTDAYAYRVVELANEKRAEAGLGELEADSELMWLAQIRAEECAEVNGLYVDGKAHTRPDGRSWGTVLTDNGYSFSSAGENCGMGYNTAASQIEGWMNSPGHKANMLDPGHTKIGVGCAVSSSGKVFAVQLFAS